MSIGGAITLIVLGLILMLRVIEVDVPLINEYALGVILVLAGIALLIFALSWGRTRSWGTYSRGGTTRVVERRVERDVDGPPPL